VYRPRSQEEIDTNTPEVVQCDEVRKEVHLTQSVNKKEFNRKYHFDRVYDCETNQERLYETAIAPMVDEVLQGFNCTVFAYGQTGTGKTHTMTGEMSSPEGSGVIPRAVGHIFRYLNGLGGVNEFTVKCSFLELYNEEITDLLASGNELPKVRILEDRSGVVLQGLEEAHVKNASDVFGILESGSAKRRTAETLLNKQSSRSHSVFIVTVSVREVLDEGEEVIRVGKLYLVDLAGSENITRSGAVDQRAKEAGNINKSLLTLGRVITALVEGQIHVPYRDSKLTRLLRDSLGGRTKTCIIATIAPTVQCQEETMSTLDYAHRAKNIKNKPEVNQKISKTTHLKEMGGEIARLKAELVAAREKNGVYMPHAQYEEDQARLKEQHERIEMLQAQASEMEMDLSMTKAELAAAMQDIAEGQYIIEQQSMCEEALAGHASGLASKLTVALSDIDALFNRVDVKNSLEDSNAKVLSDMCAIIGNRVSTMDNTLHAAVMAQLDLLTNSQNDLNNLSGMQQKSLDDIKESLDEAKGKVDDMLVSVHQGLEDLHTQSSAAVTGMAGDVSAFQAQADTSAKKASKELDRAMELLQNHADAEKKALEDMQTSHEEHRGALQLAIRAFVGEIETAMQRTTKEVLEMKSRLESSLAAQKDLVWTFKDTHEKAFESKRVGLISQIQSLIGEFAASERETVSEFCDKLHDTVDRDGDLIRENMNGVEEARNVATVVLETHQKSLEDVQQRADNEQMAIIDTVNECFDAHISSGVEMHTHASSFVKSSCDALKKHTKSVVSQAEKSAALLETGLERQKNDTNSMVENIKSVVLEEMEDAARTHHSAHCDVVQQLDESAQACKQDLSSFTEEYKSSLQEVSVRVSRAVKEEYALDDDRDNVPEKRGEDVPEQDTIKSLRAPSIETMSRKFRATLEDDDVAGLDQAEENQEEYDEENQVPNAEEVEPESPMSAIKHVATRKRSRTTKLDPEDESPSKLKAAFEQGERRRRGRSTKA
jgi:kinesin family member 11